MKTNLTGIVVIDKPAGISSFQVVNRVRKALKVKKAGHTGTLDPAATGLVTVCIGRATRLAQFLTEGDKVYEGVFTLGIETDTYDADGRRTGGGPVPPGLDLEKLRATASKLTGPLLQSPPPFSAAKHKGIPLYKLARQGIEVVKEPRRIEVFAFEITDYQAPDVHFRINCSKGTYVRSLAHEFGRLLGCGAMLSKLRRTRSGHLTLEDALSLEELERLAGQQPPETLVMPVERALSHVPGVLVNNLDALRLARGQGITTSRLAEYIREQAPALLEARPQVIRISCLDRKKRPRLVGLLGWPEEGFDKPAMVEVKRMWATPEGIVLLQGAGTGEGDSGATGRRGRGAVTKRKKRLIS